MAGALLSLGGASLLFLGLAFPIHLQTLFVAGVSAMLCGMLLLWQFQPDRRVAPTLLCFALLLRVIFLLWPHDTDLNRYLWEGRLQQQGINPYLVAPADSLTEPLRDSVWQGINHKDYPAIYGPVAQFVFRAAHLSPAPVMTLKLVFLLCDMGILALLLFVLRTYKMAERHSWLYAAHPLPVLLLIGEGHLEPLLVLPLFAGTVAIHYGFIRRGLLALGMAACVKISVIVVLPFVIRQLPKKSWVLMLLPFLLWLPFGEGFGAHLQTLARFASSETFNSPAHILLGAILSPEATTMIATTIFLLGVVVFWLFNFSGMQAALPLLALFLLSSPLLHPWYFAMLLPFAVLYRSLPWLILCSTATFLLLVSLHHRQTMAWSVPTWLLVIEFIPFIIALAGDLYRRSPIAPAVFAPPERLSILLPVHNEEDNLLPCLQSIKIPPEIPAEILVIDGGSTDNTRRLAENDPRVRLIVSPPGRGVQIAGGYNEADGDLLIVLHADTRLHDETIAQIWHHCRRNQGVAGGACTARYRHPALRFRFTEILNDWRVLLLGIAFGDQVQFFRRAAVPPEDFPAFRLMEDIELSLAIRQAGALAFLRTQVIASHRRWGKVGYSRNTLEVIGLFTSYMLLRSFGLIRDRGEAFYRYYYKKGRGKS